MAKDKKVRQQLKVAGKDGLTKEEVKTIAKETGKSTAQVNKQLNKVNKNLKDKGKEPINTDFKINGVKSQLRDAAEGGISKSELLSITESTGKSMAQVVKQLDKLNENLKNQGQEGVSLNSGAANQIIKQLGKATPQMLGYQQPDFGEGKIAQTIQSMIGTPGTPGHMLKGQMVGGSAGVPGTGLMMGGTQIKPGGRPAVQPMVAPAAIGDTTTVTAGDGTTTPTTTADAYDAGTGDAFDFQSLIDALTAMQQPAFDMTGLEDMLQTEFDQLSSQFDQRDPLQLKSLGIATNPNAIRAHKGFRKMRRDYRRGLPAMALGNTLARISRTPRLAPTFDGGLTI